MQHSFTANLESTLNASDRAIFKGAEHIPSAALSCDCSKRSAAPEGAIVLHIRREPKPPWGSEALNTFVTSTEENLPRIWT